uniref:Catsper channel auxiliary subunit epsilon n=1 Tax=Hucho hucho TaxID=62062 RepID=A0A4W5NKQ8_9TELE
MRGLPFFLAVLVLLKIEIIVGVWRYNNILEDENLFTLHNAVFLKYDGSDFVEWEYPECCNVNNKSSPNAIMKCTSPGFQMVKPLVSSPEEEEARYLFISDSFFSFIWYAVVPIDRGSTETSAKKVRMWIIDPEQAYPAEINNTALVPSTQSRYITKHFYNNGQYPVIKLKSKQTHLGHFQKDGYWEAVIPGDERFNDFHIYGQPISFQHRFVIDGQHTFYWPEPAEPNGEREVSLRLAPGSPLSLVWGTCELYRGLLLSDTGALITKNAFLTSEELMVDPGTLPVPPEGYFTVDQAALLEDGIIFRIDDALYWRDNQDRVLTEHPQLPTSGVMGIYQRTCCASNYPVQISHFNVGCPPNRHIRVARPWGMPCEMHSLTNYTILRSVLRDPQQDDIVVYYDWEKFGCLLKTHYKNQFLPSIDLYDGDSYVRNVDANFIVWDRFGRKDYSFNATMRQVACLRESQTWISMLTGGKSLEEAWGPENYRTCFKVSPGKLGNLDQPYEIMNRSSKNFLTFSQVDSATYVFNVKILDPNYSFCDLHAVFAVQTYGITIPKYQHLTTYVAIVFTLFSLCILGYSYCRYVTIFRNLLATKRHKYE